MSIGTGVPMVHVYQWYVCTNGMCVPMVHVYQWYMSTNEKIFFSSLPSLSLTPLSLCLSPPLSLSDLLHATVISLQYYFTYITLYLITFELSEI